MNASFLQERKCLHVAVNKGDYDVLRAITIARGISLQEFFTGVAQRIARGDHVAMKLLDQIVANKITDEVARIAAGIPKMSSDTSSKIDDVDKDTIFDMLDSYAKLKEVNDVQRDDK